MITIAIANHRGGVGKTATAMNLGYALRQEEKRVLLVDTDQQGSLTIYSGHEPDELAENERTLFEVLTGDLPCADAILETEGNGDLLPSSPDLAVAPMRMQELGSSVLRDDLATVADRYDFALVDCPPALDFINTCALAAAHFVLIPVRLDFLSLRSLGIFIKRCRLLQRKANTRLKFLGVLPTQVNAHYKRDQVSLERLTTLLEQQGISLLPSIPRSTIFDDSAEYGCSTLEQHPKHEAVKGYVTLAQQIVRS